MTLRKSATSDFRTGVGLVLILLGSAPRPVLAAPLENCAVKTTLGEVVTAISARLGDPTMLDPAWCSVASGVKTCGWWRGRVRIEVSASDRVLSIRTTELTRDVHHPDEPRAIYMAVLSVIRGLKGGVDPAAVSRAETLVGKGSNGLTTSEASTCHLVFGANDMSSFLRLTAILN